MTLKIYKICKSGVILCSVHERIKEKLTVKYFFELDKIKSAADVGLTFRSLLILSLTEALKAFKMRGASKVNSQEKDFKMRSQN